MDETLSGKVVLVTGGAKRVGAAICRLLHARGAQVMVHHRASVDEARALGIEVNHGRAVTSVNGRQRVTSMVVQAKAGGIKT